MEYRCTSVLGIFIVFLVQFLLLNRSFASPPKPIYQQKCAEYAKLVYSFEDDPTGISSDKILVNNCVTIQTLIHGGENATAKEFPFMALIGFGPAPYISWKCGGSLISETFVLSAAHCSFSKNAGPALWVRLGDLDVTSEKDEAMPENIAIAERIVHPGYREKIKYHDIVLFRLEKAATFNPYVRPICLYGGEHVDQQKSRITGWGATEKGPYSALLQKAAVQLNSEKYCQAHYGEQYLGLPLGLNWTTMVCAKGDDFRDTCKGDSGGPLFISINSEHYCMVAQVGITSFGAKCETNIPGVYTRVSAYIPWIESKVWPTEKSTM